MDRPQSRVAETVGLVFCGGEGTRLRPLSYLIRKEMLPVGRTRKPILEFVVDHLRRNGIRDIVFLGSKEHGGDIANYFGDGRRFGVRILHQPDPDKCSGTGHALIWAIEQLALQDKELLVYYGDMLNTVDLRDLLKKHCTLGAAATLVVSNEYEVPKGIATINGDGVITAFKEKPNWPGPEKIGIALLCLNSQRLIRNCGGLPSTESDLQKSKFRDVMGDILTHLINHDTVISYITSAPWLDVGSFESYAKVREDVNWLIGEVADPLPAEQGLSVFISYHICEANKQLIEDILVPCLKAAGIRVISGGTLERDYSVNMSPTQIALNEIDRSDGVIAFATPDTANSTPSEYVTHEVAYAHGKGKLWGLFVEKGTNIPAPWYGGYIWSHFQRGDSGPLIRDVLVRITKFG